MTGPAGRGAARLHLARVLCAGWAATAAAAAHAGQTEGFAVADYFRVWQFTELALSDDGRHLAFVAGRRSLEENGYRREVHLRSPPDAASSTMPEALADARSLAWIPGTRELAFLSGRGGSTQVWSCDADGGALRQWTDGDDPVESFLFAPDGRTLAYLSRPTTEPGTSLYRRFRDDDTGILIDPATTSSHDFVNPHWHGMVQRAAPVLRVAAAGGTAVRVPVPGEPSGDERAYHWSSDGELLSVVYVAADQPAAQLRDERTSLGVYEPGTAEFQVLAEAVAREAERAGRSFAGGEWLPGERKLRRADRRAQALGAWEGPRKYHDRLHEGGRPEPIQGSTSPCAMQSRGHCNPAAAGPGSGEANH